MNSIFTFLSILLLALVCTKNMMQAKSDEKPSEKKSDKSVVETILDSNKIYQQIQKTYKKYTPEIKKIFLKHIGPVTKQAFENDRAMRLLFDKSYDFMPLPFRLAIDRADYINFCIKNKQKIVKLIPEK